MNLNELFESLRTENPCWKGYHPVGTKQKDGRTVPNCVPNANEGVEEASPEATFNALKGLKSWQVVIMNNYYRGKYPDYSGRYYYVLATSPEQARQVVLDNADAILQELLAMKSVNGRKILPRGSALRITADRIGEIRDGTEAGRMTTAGFKKMFGPQGPMMVKLNNGAIADVQGQEQGVAEGVTPASTSKVLRLIQRHHPEWFDTYGMGEVEDTVVDLADMGQFSGMSAADALELVGQELESLYGQQGVAEGDKIGHMDADKFDDAMARLKQLAGQEPRKTVWDPVKRVYKTVPVNPQPK